MSYKTIVVDRDGDLLVITLNRPEVKNALNDLMREELLSALDQAEHDTETRAVILNGGMDVFAAGADVSGFVAATASQIFQWPGSRRVVEKLETLPKPVVAAVSGYALGAGCELALACDLRVASETAAFGQPEIRLGLIPGAGGTQRLARLVGAARAKQMVFTGDPIDAQEALRIGLVNAVVPVDRLLGEAKALARRCTRFGSVALAAAKLAINVGTQTDIHSAQALEASLFTFLFSTEDQKEGVRAFLDKRRPAFKNR